MKYIKKHENFLDEKLLESCVQYSDSVFNNNNMVNKFNYNYNLWPKHVILDSNPILIHIIVNVILNSIKTKLGHTNIKSKIMLFCFLPGSHLPWHQDAHHNGAFTLYLNDEWDKNNGGLFLYEDDDQIKAIVPKKNLAVENVGGIWHNVSCLTPRSKNRFSIQVFL